MKMIFMAYLTESIKAVDFYCKAFNAEAKNCFKAADNDNFYAHAEIVINNQTVLAISDTAHYSSSFIKGSNMQFWLSFEDEKSLDTAYNTLKEGAEIHHRLAPCEWCSKMADLTDKFGIRWLLNLM